MKRIIVVLFSLTFLSSCYVKFPKKGQTDAFAKNQLTGIAKDNYQLLDNIEHQETSKRFRVLFFGFGGSRLKDEAYRREIAYAEALKINKVDGLVNPNFNTKYWKIPFILFPPFGISSYTTTVYGRAYKMK